MEDIIRQMLIKQLELNNILLGPNWRTGVTNKGRELDYYLCIIMETAEAINSFNWKHWSDINKPDDVENIKMEVIDILHFLFSEMFLAVTTLTDTISDSEAIDKVMDEWFSEHTYLHLLSHLGKYEEDFDKEKFITFLRSVLERRINWKISNSRADISYRERIHIVGDIYRMFITVAAPMSLDEIYNIFIPKVTLNAFRFKNGYQEGTYIKMWKHPMFGNDPVEDNVALVTIVEKLDNLELLEYELTKVYNELELVVGEEKK